MYSLSRLVLILFLIGLTGCTVFVPKPDINDVIAPTVAITTTTVKPAITVLETTATITANLPPTSSSIAVESSQTPPPSETVITVITTTIPTVIITSTPTFTLSPTATRTPIAAIFLTPTADWQPVQVGQAVIEIPIGWIQFPIESEGAFFYNVDPTIPGVESGGQDIAGLRYLESNLDMPPQEGWMEATVDGYTARYDFTPSYDNSPDGFDIEWQGVLRIYAPQRRHSLAIKCTANSLLDEGQQREFHQYCESLIQHWIETTQILE